MTHDTVYEVSVSLDYKNKKKAPKIGMCDMLYTPNEQITYENLREHFSFRQKRDKKLTKKTRNTIKKWGMETGEHFYGTILAILKGKRGYINFDPNFEGYANNWGIKIENKTHFIKVWRRDLTVTTFGD